MFSWLLLLLGTSVAFPQGPKSNERFRQIAQEALAAERLQLWDQAIAKYTEELAIEPHNLDAEMRLARAYREVHNYDEAKRLLDRAALDHPRRSEPFGELGDLEIELQSYPSAAEHLRAALALSPTDEGSRVRLAVAYKSSGDVPAALAELDKVLAQNSRNALAYYERAEIYSDRNQNDTAQRDAAKAVEMGSNAEGRLLLAKILLRPRPNDSASDVSKRCEEAVVALDPLIIEPAVPGHEQSSEMLFLVSRAYRCAGRDDDAQKTMDEFEVASKKERTTKENQIEAKHLVQQANDAAMKNDLRGALDFLQQALEKDPNYGAAYSQLAKLDYSAGDLDKASEAIDRALTLDPYQPDFLYVQGKILEKQGKLDGALAAFERATLVNPKESDAFFEIGTIYQQRNERAKAAAAYRKAVELAPDDADYRKALEALK